MLRCAQSENNDVSYAAGDMSVFERQRDIFQRMYHPDHHPSPPHTAAKASQFPASQFLVDGNFASLWHMDENAPNAVIDVNGKSSRSNSSVTAVAPPPPPSKFNAGKSTTRKRKAEVCLEGDNKKWENETGEVQSEITVKCEGEISGSSAPSEKKKKAAASAASDDGQKSNYIHVRARRGQATDSHSLAERARREKISKKMKCLQDLVPGCNKVVGKAGMLDEIINYVQSLQKQVEFLSMKLAALNPGLDFSPDNLFPKELPAYIGTFPTTAIMQPLEPANNSNNNSNNNPCVSIADLYLDPSSYLQQMQGWENDWQSAFNGGFH